MKFVIARYYFNSLFRAEANESFIADLKKEPFVDDGAYMYALGNFQNEIASSYNFIRGTFGRVVKSEDSQIYNKEKQAFIEVETSDKVQAMIEFLIHHDSHLIFIEQSSKIDPTSFKNKFQRIYGHNSKHQNSFEIDFVSSEEDIYKALKTWDKVTQATFKNLRSSNPSSSDTFERIEQLLKESKSDVVNLSLKNTSNGAASVGLNTESMLIKEALSLSANGYGEAKLKGTKEGTTVQVGTKKTVRKIEVNFDEDGALTSFVKLIEEIQHYEKK